MSESAREASAREAGAKPKVIKVVSANPGASREADRVVRAPWPKGAAGWPPPEPKCSELANRIDALAARSDRSAEHIVSEKAEVFLEAEEDPRGVLFKVALQGMLISYQVWAPDAPTGSWSDSLVSLGTAEPEGHDPSVILIALKNETGLKQSFVIRTICMVRT